MTKLLATLLLLAAPAAFAKTVATVAVLPQGAAIKNGSSVQFSATCTYTDGSSDNCDNAGGVAWTTSSPSRLSMNSGGVLTATLDPGTGQFIDSFAVAIAGGVAGRAGIYTQHAGDTWFQYMTPDVHNYADFGNNFLPMNVAVGSTIALGTGAIINNSGAGSTGFPFQNSCSWSSSAPSVATVSSIGHVTAVAPGTATIICKHAGDAAFGSSTISSWTAPGNVITLSIVNGGTSSNTWYVRPDGGSPFVNAAQTPTGQCDGKHDAAYSGSGINQPCAVSNLRDLWADQQTYMQTKWMISGGDTVIVRQKQGGYTTGVELTGNVPVNCAGNSGSCYMPSIPSGTAGQHTRILGENYASCHSDTGQKTLLNMTGFAGTAFNFKDSQFVDVACFEITDKEQCTTNGNYSAATHCTTANSPGQNGVTTSALSASDTLSDLFVHGLARDGLTGATGVGVVADNIHIRAMPDAGINMDDNPWYSSNISVAGGFTLTNSLTEFTGCVEEYPVVHNYPYIECRDQSLGGYGDGFGTASTSGDWAFDHDVWRYNFQDGLDLLHSGMRSLSITNSQSYGNDGQQYKIGSGQTVIFANNTILHNCERILSAFGDEPSSAILPGVSACRAGGDGVVFSFAAYGSVLYENNSFAGYGATSYDLFCEGGFDSCPNTQTVYRNNINLGIVKSSYDAAQNPGLFYGESDSMPANGGWAVRDHNLYYNFRNGGCPNPLNEGELCSDPNFINEPTLTISSDLALDTFSFALTANSPAKNAGVALPVLNLQATGLSLPNLLGIDLLGTTRGNPPSIGALEIASTATTPPAPAPPAPPTTPAPPTQPTPPTPPTPPTAPTPPTTPAPPTKQATTLSLTASPTAATIGQTVTLTVLAAPIANVIPTGRVIFTVDGKAIAAVLRSGQASISMDYLPPNTYSVSATYAGDSKYLAATSNTASITITLPTESSAINVTIGQPGLGLNVSPGAVRRLFGTVMNGVTNQVAWSVKSGGATLSSTTGSWIEVTAPSLGSSCLASGSPTSAASTVTIEATSVEDTTKTAEITLNVCQPTIQVSSLPGYHTLYSN